jgi:hypothetical protein
MRREELWMVMVSEGYKAESTRKKMLSTVYNFRMVDKGGDVHSKQEQSMWDVKTVEVERVPEKWSGEKVRWWIVWMFWKPSRSLKEGWWNNGPSHGMFPGTFTL